MDLREVLEALLAAAERSGITVRKESLGGEGGGLCRIKGRAVLFVDVAADLATQLDRSLQELADWPGFDTQFIRPDLRELLASKRQRPSAG